MSRNSWKEERRLKFVGRDEEEGAGRDKKKEIRKGWWKFIRVTFVQDDNTRIGKLDVLVYPGSGVYSDLV